MVVHYGSSSQEMLGDFGVVPENTYTSPLHSPFCQQSYDAVGSPASSDISSVDSAFDELAGVIPELDAELSSDESQKCYKDLSTMSPYASSGYQEDDYSNPDSDGVGNRSPSMYDSMYAYHASPKPYQSCAEEISENVLVQSVKSSAKRQLPSAWYNNYSDLSEARMNDCAKRMKLSDPVQMARHTETLLSEQMKSVYQNNYAQPQSQDYNNNDVYHQPSRIYQENSAPTENKNSSSLLMWDEDVLTKGFEILAEYISQDTPVVPEEDSSSNDVPEQKVFSDRKQDALSDVARYKAAIQAAASDSFREKEDPPMMFSMSNSNIQQATPKKISLKQERQNCSSAVEMIRNWRAPPARPRRAAICLQSTKPRLYNFLLELLQDPERYPCIEWVDESQGIFKFLDSAQIASLWGHRKNKPHMKYENFARSLRTYIAKGILTKPRNKLVYQFTSKMG